MTHQQKPQAVVFDCDGTLVDTETISDATLQAVLARHGYEPSEEDLTAILGRPWAWTWQRFSDRAGLTDEAAFRESVRDEFVTRFEAEGRLFPDAVDTIRELRRRGLPLAICTSSTRRHLDRVLALGLHDQFDASVAAEDTDEHKPDPAPYREAAHRLGVPPDRCVAVEDSPIGLAAARGAGMATVAIARGGVGLEHLAAADVVVKELTAEVVLEAATAARG